METLVMPEMTPARRRQIEQKMVRSAQRTRRRLREYLDGMPVSLSAEVQGPVFHADIGPLKPWTCHHPECGAIVLYATDPRQLAQDNGVTVLV
jgi:hypothetical protein